MSPGFGVCVSISRWPRRSSPSTLRSWTTARSGSRRWTGGWRRCRRRPHIASRWLGCVAFEALTRSPALTIVTELHGFGRFGSPRDLMSYLGLVPSEFSSGDSQRQGGITKAGNGRVRRLLIEASWHQRNIPITSKALAKRREGQPAAVVAIAERAQKRLHQRYWRLVNRGKAPTKAVTAVARELSGFVWSVLFPPSVAAAVTDPPGRERAAPGKQRKKSGRPQTAKEFFSSSR